MTEKKAQQDTRKDQERSVLTPEESDRMLRKSEKKYRELIENIRESEARFRSLFELSPQAVALTDAGTGRIVDANKKLCRLSGYAKEELIGNSTTGLGFYSEDERRTFVEALCSSGEVRGMEMDFRIKNGDILKALMYASTVEIAGKPLILTVFHDVTTERQLEDQLRQAHKMEAIGTLSGGIAHDFNNILAIILGYSEIAENQVHGSSPVQSSLQEVKSAALRARDIVQQLLTFTRKGELKHQVIDIRPIVKEGLKMLRSTIPTTVEFRESIPDASFPVKIDATQVHQILVNLCTNASHAMEAGGSMAVQLETVSLSREELDFDKGLHPGDYVKLRVEDTGQGIPEADLHRIFDPYYTTKKVGNGSGLGLSVVMGLVKTHGGGIRVGSELGVGTTFEVFFPLAEPAAEASPIQGSPEIPRGSERILFVDDEQMIVDLNRQRLELLGYRVTACTSPLDALATIVRDAEGFDLVITDMTMPKMAGDRLIKEILGIRPSLPIILCTGYSERISAESARALGVSRYLKKPLEMQTLAVSVREALDK